MYHLRKGLLLVFYLAAFGNAAELLPGEQKHNKARPGLMARVLEARSLINKVELTRDRIALVEANRILREVLREAPDFAPAHREFSLVFYFNEFYFGYLDERDHSQVWRSLNSAHKLDKEYGQIAFDRAYALIYRGDYDRASAEILKLDRSIDPVAFELLKMDLAIAQKNYDLARLNLKELEHLKIKMTDIPYRTAQIFHHSDGQDDAWKALREAIGQGHNRKDVFLLGYYISIVNRDPVKSLEMIENLKRFNVPSKLLNGYSSRVYGIWAEKNIGEKKPKAAIECIGRMEEFGAPEKRTKHLKLLAYKAWIKQLIHDRHLEKALKVLLVADQNGMSKNQIDSYSSHIEKLQKDKVNWFNE
ncbi:Uncharacterised protein [BD1-7 clade bacterium]|uniref:Beta-barrel assembly-enhancing protease n=1 Tax=BD1-7 clade bacterium TaxID=2029982 RepID=A0A5S9QRM0_9GAMM|nr:Uncharacterised protein [BD1-7 clade bacterium]